jgi:hypothetical protein
MVTRRRNHGPDTTWPPTRPLRQWRQKHVGNSTRPSSRAGMAATRHRELCRSSTPQREGAAPGAAWGIFRSTSPGLGGQQPVPAAVEQVGPAVAALVVVRGDHLGPLGVDDRLEHQLDALANDVDSAAGAGRIEPVGRFILDEVTGSFLQLSMVGKSRRSPGGPPPWWTPASGPPSGTSTGQTDTQRGAGNRAPCRLAARRRKDTAHERGEGVAASFQ